MANPADAFQEFFKLLNPNSNPNFDLQKLGQIQQKTIEAVTQANKTLFDGVQKIIKTQSEFFQEQAQSAANIASKALAAKTPEENLGNQTRFAQNYFDANLQNIQSAAKSASDTSVKVFDIINKQTVENLNEFSKISAQQANKKASNA